MSDEMSQNRYSRFIDAGAVLDDYVNTLRTHGFNNVAELGQARDEALARIAELTPPRDETLREHAEHILESHGLLNPAVDEEARQRARGVIHRYAIKWGKALAYNDVEALLSDVIDALNYTTPEPTPEEFADPANWHPIEEHPYLNDPPTPPTRSQTCLKGCDCSCCYGMYDCYHVTDPCNCGMAAKDHAHD